MIELSPNKPKSLVRELIPFGIGWAAVALALAGLWVRTEQDSQRQIALSRAETSFRLQAVYHVAMMELQGRPGASAPADSKGLTREFKWRAMDRGDLGGQLVSLFRQERTQRLDEWERKALKRMNAGDPQVSEVIVRETGGPVLRYMGGMRMENACMGCHSNSGIALGGVLGGISISVPVTTLSEVLEEPNRRIVLGAFLVAWTAVLAAMGIARHRHRRAARQERQAADSLQNSELRLKEAQRLANMGYWEHDHRTGRILWSEETFRIFGLQPGSLPPSFDAFMERVHPEDRVRVAEEWQKHLQEHLPYQTEYRILRDSVEIRHIVVSCHTEFDEAGIPVRSLGVNLDLSDRRKIDEALRGQAEAHRILLETSLDGCLEVDETGRIVEVNDAYLRLSGYRREQLLGKRARELEATDDSGAVKKQTARVRQKGMDRFETWHLGQDGRRIPLQASVTFLPSTGGFLYFLRDLSAERASRQALAQSEAKFAEAFRTIPEVLLLTDLSSGQIIDLNPGFEKMTGWKREEVLGRTSVELGFWQDLEARNALLSELQEHGESGVHRIPFYLKDGSIRLGELRSVRLGHGTPPLALTMVRDVTELDRAESSLRASEARFRATFDQAAIGMAHLDAEGRIQLANAPLARFLGVSEAELPGRSFESFLSEDQQKAREEFRQRVENGGFSSEQRDARTQRPDGTCAWGRWNTTAIKGADGSLAGFLETVEDITELKESQSVALEAEAIAAKGQMAAYVAHEINGPLAGIKSAVELIQVAVPEDHPRRPYVDLVRREVDRIAGIVRSIYELHQVIPSQAQDIEVSAVIQDVATLMAPRFKALQVTLELDPGEHGLRATLRADLLRQVLFNLFLNALEASAEGGQVQCRAAEDGGDLEIRISDQGQGIPENFRERIWEPGFTTKRNAVQGGLGLGLATSRKLLESIQGSIRFESNPGQGTTFFVRIPVKY